MPNRVFFTTAVVAAELAIWPLPSCDILKISHFLRNSKTPLPKNPDETVQSRKFAALRHNAAMSEMDAESGMSGANFLCDGAFAAIIL
ncbi:hypothetical protein [Novosphingobium guangzhouense]|uniref:Uncharacterized protein n=1 Tax=Novosphingobium guangzhouense TaxID=1850347 RepID=A0A2K2G186_9SPHN|nr:hypothetical protein [Novosphingobium guangzhouense]PNU04787.1 hypothetical protein A8V01_18740 [Novosphingobium guangzhouense]